MKTLSTVLLSVIISGCSLLPRSHDPVMLNQLVVISIQIEAVDCNKPDWTSTLATTKQLARYADWRQDPQAENLTGLQRHVERIAISTNTTFCELGKKTANGRILAAKTAWEAR